MTLAPWTKNIYADDINCRYCLYSRNLAHGVKLGYCDSDGTCLDGNGCRRRVAHLPCTAAFNSLPCQGLVGHDGPHYFSNTRWTDGVSD